MSEDWAYIAGLFDGEGSLAIYQNGPRMSISNRHKETLEWILVTVGAGRIWENKAQSQFKRSAPCYQWDCGAQAIRTTLPKLIPYLRVNKERAIAMVEYLKTVEPSSNKNVTPAGLAAREAFKKRINGRQIVWGNETGK